jgi:DUF1365 family protein
VRSAIYEGSVRHRRLAPVRHEFQHRVAMAYIDLAELESERDLARLLTRGRPGMVRFRRGDYFGDPGQPLALAVRELVLERTGVRPTGPIRILTQLRTLGWNFNPITLYYCFNGDDSALEAVVFEVTNTPWSERHAYVALADDAGRVQSITMRKALHVSPYMPMDLDYHFTCSAPGPHATVRFELERAGAVCFDADLRCRRAAALDRPGLRRLMLRYPLMPLVVSAEIYFEALRLALRRAPLHRHPKRPTSHEHPNTTSPGRKVA